jgi:hypothetical protein
MPAKYEWKTDRAGNRRFVRTVAEPVIERISEGKEEMTPVEVTEEAQGEMAIEPPDEPVAAEIPIEKPKTTTRRKTAKS